MLNIEKPERKDYNKKKGGEKKGGKWKREERERVISSSSTDQMSCVTLLNWLIAYFVNDSWSYMSSYERSTLLWTNNKNPDQMIDRQEICGTFDDALLNCYFIVFFEVDWMVDRPWLYSEAGKYWLI
jgi:hypothetical protein